jgi:hypothetical protein
VNGVHIRNFDIARAQLLRFAVNDALENAAHLLIKCSRMLSLRKHHVEKPGVANAGDSCATWPRLAAQRRRDERSRSRCSCAALRQLQRGFSIDAVSMSTTDHRIDAGRERRRGAWGRAAAPRGGSVPLVSMTSMMMTNRAAPGGRATARDWLTCSRDEPTSA